MQKFERIDPYVVITPTAVIATDTHGGRAKCLQRLVRLQAPVPKTVALSFETVAQLGSGYPIDTAEILHHFGKAPLLSVRPSSADPDWGGPGAMLKIGMGDRRHLELSQTHGEDAATGLYLRFIKTYATHVARLDPDAFLALDPTIDGLKEALAIYEEEAEEPFPQDTGVQLQAVLQSMARAWQGTTARLLRQARGAPADAGLGLVVQDMALSVGPGESGSGVFRSIDPATGERQINGRYLRQSFGRDALQPKTTDALYLASDPRGPALQDEAPDAFTHLMALAETFRTRLREEMEIEFTLENSKLRVLDAVRVARSSRAAVRVAVALAEDGVISRDEALLRIHPRALNELMHSQVDNRATRDVIARGIAASPGGACGRLVFSGQAAQSFAAQGEPCILVRRETTPEDIRGMHVAQGILTERGGMTSHAAVIARGLGLPCIVGASEMKLSMQQKTLRAPDGRVFHEGDRVTLDGTAGEVLAGGVPLLEPALDGPFQSLLVWAGDACDISIRANADTPSEARTALTFKADGIGLCRTEHMFFDEKRMMVMRAMIFAEAESDRRATLEQLLPMQRADFSAMFEIMAGKPVTIRLFDPPLHEFLPSDREGLRSLAGALDMPLSDVTRRVESLAEFNPMLGLRGVRLGVTMPEIYDMQARAIFEAVAAAAQRGTELVPEIMLPLVSARREVELVKTNIDAVAAAVRNETGVNFTYKLGVMVETPRAALRAGDIVGQASFLSFGTNDLTQMTYGLSRDDAGRFMSAYVTQGVFPEDPFHTLDQDGVGELLTLGAARAREQSPNVTLSVCGEQGGDPDTIAFCRACGFDYVSCSPFRVPVARLAAAHLAVRDKTGHRP